MLEIRWECYGIGASEEGVSALWLSVTLILNRGQLSRFLTNFSCKSQSEFASNPCIRFNLIWVKNCHTRQLESLIKSLSMPEVFPCHVSTKTQLEVSPNIRIGYAYWFGWLLVDILAGGSPPRCALLMMPQIGVGGSIMSIRSFFCKVLLFNCPELWQLQVPPHIGFGLDLQGFETFQY